MDAPVAMLFDPATAWRQLATSWDRPKTFETAQRRLERLCGDLVEGAVKKSGMATTEAIDLLLRSPEFFEARRAHWAQLKDVSFSEIPPRRWVPKNLYSVSRSLAVKLEEGIALSNAAGRVVARLAKSDADVNLQVSTSEEQRAADALWFLRDPVLPDVIVQALLGATRQEAIRLTICGLVHHGRFRSLQIVNELAAIWQRDIRRHLRALASLPGSDVSPDLVPLPDRVDIGAAYARQRKILDAIHAA